MNDSENPQFCTYCGSENIEMKGDWQSERVETELGDRTDLVCFLREHYYCSDCRNFFGDLDIYPHVSEEYFCNLEEGNIIVGKYDDSRSGFVTLITNVQKGPGGFYVSTTEEEEGDFGECHLDVGESILLDKKDENKVETTCVDEVLYIRNGTFGKEMDGYEPDVDIDNGFHIRYSFWKDMILKD